MAHPKRRQSKTRTLKRRTHDKAVAPTLAVCPNCGAYYVYHTVCPTCGYYRGKVAIVKEAAEYWEISTRLSLVLAGMCQTISSTTRSCRAWLIQVMSGLRLV